MCLNKIFCLAFEGSLISLFCFILLPLSPPECCYLRSLVYVPDMSFHVTRIAKCAVTEWAFVPSVSRSVTNHVLSKISF